MTRADTHRGCQTRWVWERTEAGPDHWERLTKVRRQTGPGAVLPTSTPCPSVPRPACWCEWRGQGGREPLEEATGPEFHGRHRWEWSGHTHRSAVLNLMSF